MSLRDFAALYLFGVLTIHGFGEVSFGQDKQASPPIESLDQSTIPFQFRSAVASFPVVENSSDCELTVAIRGFEQAADQTLSCIFRLVRVEDGKVIAREQTQCRLDGNGDSESIALLDRSPDEAGVYELRCRLTRPADPLWSRFQRKEEDLAASAFPILVKTHPSDAPDTTMKRLPVWEAPVQVNEIDPDTWQALKWVPGNANRLVPNVKWVGETIANSTWRSATESIELAATLDPNEAFLGSLPKQATHRIHELILDVEQKLPSLSETPLLIQLSRKTDFASVDQELTCRVSRKLDLSAGGLAECSPLRILYVPGTEQLFCRIVNQDQDQSIEIRSIGYRELRTKDVETSSQSEGSTENGIVLRLRDDEWVKKLTRDLDLLEQRKAYVQSTIRLYRLSVAIARLSDYAAWFGCNGYDLPAPTSNSDRDWDSWMISQACERLQSDGIHFRDGQKTLSVGNGVQCAVTDGNTELQLMQEIVKRTDTPSGKPGKPVVLEYATLPLATRMDLSSALSQTKIASVWNTIQSEKGGVDEPTRGTLRVFWASDSPQSGNLLVANASPWRQQMEFAFRGTLAECKPHELCVHGSLGLHHEGGNCFLQVPAGSVTCLTVSFEQEIGDTIPIIGWKGTMSNPQPTIALCKSVIGEVIGSTGKLELPNMVYPHLRNGGFESDGQVGIVGWMQTQFPPDAVVLDSNEAIEGSRSIRMTNSEKSSGRTWIVSETIPVPETARLAVSMSVRAAKASSRSGDQTPHRIRISLEGERGGVPFQVISELALDRNGQWNARRLVLEAEAMDLQSLETIRLTIDSLSLGTIWIDDVRLHHQFATEEERDRIHGQAYLAVQGIRRGNLASVTRLLSNEWTRDLLERSDWTLSQPSLRLPADDSRNKNQTRPAWSATTIASRPDSPKTPNTVPSPATEIEAKDSAETRGVAERIRGWLPRPIRF